MALVRWERSLGQGVLLGLAVLGFLGFLAGLERELTQARLKELAAHDRVAREIVESHAQVQARRRQIATAQRGIQAAQTSYERNLTRNAWSGEIVAGQQHFGPQEHDRQVVDRARPP